MFACGAIQVIAVFGVGKLAIWFFRLRALPWYWRLGFIGVLGQTGVNLFVQALLLSGESSAYRLRILAWVVIAIGLLGHLVAARTGKFSSQLSFPNKNRLLYSLIVVAWLTNLAVALAPSSKIDELYYHMLVPKRIAADGKLQFYRLPIEAAIVPQMQYQISLSPAYALGAPEAGNVLSLSYSIVLGLFVIGLLRDQTGNESLAALGGLGCSIGAYQTVWHTTEGPAAIGELALVVALCGVLWPKSLRSSVSPMRHGFLLVAAASLAASTKISLWPICAVVSLLAAWNTFREMDPAKRSVWRASIALSPWVLMQFPLMIWTYYASGSFWGPVMANVFRPSVFPPELLKILEQTRVVNQRGLLSNMEYAAVELCPLIFGGLIVTVWRACRKEGVSLLIIGFLVFQGALILWQLPYDFRFLGGLIYVPLIAAISTLARTGANLSETGVISALGTRVIAHRNWIVLALVVPWLAFQMYYARPFAETTFGILTRHEFRERYVALTQDYVALNSILPADAVLYVANGRIPLFYAPRPVVLAALDLHESGPVYRLTLLELPAKQPFGASATLECGDVIYKNLHAIVETYRRPGAYPKTGTVTVQSCRVEPAVRVDNAAPPSR